MSVKVLNIFFHIVLHWRSVSNTYKIIIAYLCKDDWILQWNFIFNKECHVICIQTSTVDGGWCFFKLTWEINMRLLKWRWPDTQHQKLLPFLTFFLSLPEKENFTYMVNVFVADEILCNSTSLVLLCWTPVTSRSFVLGQHGFCNFI